MRDTIDTTLNIDAKDAEILRRAMHWPGARYFNDDTAQRASRLRDVLDYICTTEARTTRIVVRHGRVGA